MTRNVANWILKEWRIQWGKKRALKDVSFEIWHFFLCILGAFMSNWVIKHFSLTNSSFDLSFSCVHVLLDLWLNYEEFIEAFLQSRSAWIVQFFMFCGWTFSIQEIMLHILSNDIRWSMKMMTCKMLCPARVNIAVLDNLKSITIFKFCGSQPPITIQIYTSNTLLERFTNLIFSWVSTIRQRKRVYTQHMHSIAFMRYNLLGCCWIFMINTAQVLWIWLGDYLKLYENWLLCWSFCSWF